MLIKVCRNDTVSPSTTIGASRALLPAGLLQPKNRCGLWRGSDKRTDNELVQQPSLARILRRFVDEQYRECEFHLVLLRVPKTAGCVSFGRVVSAHG